MLLGLFFPEASNHIITEITERSKVLGAVSRQMEDHVELSTVFADKMKLAKLTGGLITAEAFKELELMDEKLKTKNSALNEAYKIELETAEKMSSLKQKLESSDLRRKIRAAKNAEEESLLIAEEEMADESNLAIQLYNVEKAKSLRRRAKKIVEFEENIKPRSMDPAFSFIREAEHSGQRYQPLLARKILTGSLEAVFSVFQSDRVSKLVALSAAAGMPAEMITLLTPLFVLCALVFSMFFFAVFGIIFLIVAIAYNLIVCLPRRARFTISPIMVGTALEYVDPVTEKVTFISSYGEEELGEFHQDHRPDEQALVAIKHRVQYARVIEEKNKFLHYWDAVFHGQWESSRMYYINYTLFQQVTNPLHTSTNRSVQERISSAETSISRFQTIGIDVAVESLLHTTSNTGVFVGVYYPHMHSIQQGGSKLKDF